MSGRGPGVEWDADMLATLRGMRAKGRPLYDCSLAVGVGYATCVMKARELGIAQRMNRGTIPGPTAVRERRRRK